MRVLLVGNHWTAGPGGAETMLVLTADLLRRAGHEVQPFAVAEADPARALPAATTARFPRAAGSGARTRAGAAVAGVWSPQAYVALRRLLRDWRPDVVHVHHVYERLTLSVLDALRGVPTVMTLHDYKPVCPNFRLFRPAVPGAPADDRALAAGPGGTGPGAGAPCTSCVRGDYAGVVRHRCLEGSRWRSVAAAADGWLGRARGVYEAVDAFVAPSAFLRDRVVASGLAAFAAERVHVLPNPVEAAGAPRGQPAPGAPVLFAGRLVAEKGVGTLLEAAALLPDGVRLRLVGSGRLEEHVRRRVAGRALPVDLVGACDPVGVARHLRDAACAVVPSVWWENCPMAVLEAGAQGVPVVASAVGGVPEIVEHEGTGLLVPPGDARALADAVTRLAGDPALAAAYGTAAWERMRDRHDPHAHVAALVELYSGVRA